MTADAVNSPDSALAGKRERSKAANREAILEAARRVFGEIGFEAASVRDIIRGTDLASGTFYNYFKSKEEVFEALIDDSARRFRPILRAVLDRAQSLDDLLFHALVAYFRFIVEENRGEPLAKVAPHVRTVTPQMTALFQEVRESLEIAIARGIAPAVNASYLTCACVGIAQELGECVLGAKPHDIEGAARFAANLVLCGVSFAAAADAA
jgi:AcrR family transcriptional regulator